MKDHNGCIAFMCIWLAKRDTKILSNCPQPFKPDNNVNALDILGNEMKVQAKARHQTRVQYTHDCHQSIAHRAVFKSSCANPPAHSEQEFPTLATGTLFENYSKCRICHFPPFFVLLKRTCLVTLFDRKLQVFKNSPKWTIFGTF